MSKPGSVLGNHQSNALNLRRSRKLVITRLSEVAAGRIVTFHPPTIAVWLQVNARLCDSPSLSRFAFAQRDAKFYHGIISGWVPSGFHPQDTSG